MLYLAKVAVAKALTVLQEFYTKAAAATAFAQQDPASDAPATFSKPYTGMGGSNTGVVGMLEAPIQYNTSLRMSEDLVSLSPVFSNGHAELARAFPSKTAGGRPRARARAVAIRW